jgi:hypothetical protein
MMRDQRALEEVAANICRAILVGRALRRGASKSADYLKNEVSKCIG